MEPVRSDERHKTNVTPVDNNPNVNKAESTIETNRSCENMETKQNLTCFENLPMVLNQPDPVHASIGCDASIDEAACVLRSPVTTLNQVRKFWAPSGNEYIKKKRPTAGKITELDFSARFTIETMDIKLHSEGRLMLVNDDLLMRVKIQQPELVDETTDFKQAKKVLFEQIRIEAVYFDTFRKEQARLRGELLKTLKEIKINSETSSEFAEDCLELWGIVGACKTISYKRVCEEVVKIRLSTVQLTNIATNLYDLECTLSRRAELIPCMGKLLDSNSSELMKALKAIQSKAVEIHRKQLLERAPACLWQGLEGMCPTRIMFIGVCDVELFANLVDSLDVDVFQQPLEHLADRFVDEVNAMKIGKFNRGNALTYPVFILLCKHLEELMNEISKRTKLNTSELIKSDAAGGWQPATDITWNNEDYSTKCLEREYRFIFKLLDHFKPSPNIGSKPFEYNFRLMMNCENEMVVNPYQTVPESFIWYCLLDDALSSITTRKKLTEYENILQKYASLIRAANQDQLEIVRTVTHSLVHYIACTIGIFEQNDKANLKVDKQILRKQLHHLIPEITLSPPITNRFRELVKDFIDFWNRKRDVIEKIPSKINLPDLKQIANALMDVVLVALEKNVPAEQLLKFIRVYNDFLVELNEVSFDWFIKAIPGVDMQNGIPKMLLEAIDQSTFCVTDPVKFVPILQIMHNNVQIPKHYVVLIVKAQLSLILQQLNMKQWSSGLALSEADQITTTAILISSLRNRLPDLNHQLDYDSFEQFLATQMEPIVDFESCAESRKDSFNRNWITSEKDIDKTMDECDEMINIYNKQTLREAFRQYSDHYQQYISLEKKIRIARIVEALKATSKTLHFKSWNEQFKQVQLPKILAGIAALWFTLAYENASNGKRNPKLHTIQVLCILRLLSVDNPDPGVTKHFAEIQPGQGKTLAIRLIAVLLALTGHSVCIWCCSEYLARRDRTDFKRVFARLDVQESISFTTMDNFNCDNRLNRLLINGQRVLLTGFESSSSQYTASARRLMTGNLDNSVLLIDDTILLHKWRYWNPAIHVILPGLDKIQSRIWHLSSDQTAVDVIKNSINEYIDSSEFEDKDRWKLSLESSNEDNLLSQLSIAKSCTNKDLFQEHLESMIETARYIRKPTGIINSNYLALFNYLKHEMSNAASITEDEINYGYLKISYDTGKPFTRLLIDFPLVLGVFEAFFYYPLEICDVSNWTKMSSVFGCSRLQFDEDVNFCSLPEKIDWMNCISNRARAVLETHRPVIVVFEDAYSLNQFQIEHSKQFNKLNILTADTADVEKQLIIKKAALAGMATLVTSEMGIGSDFKSRAAVENAGGLHVIQTFFSYHPTQENKIKGLTARHGNKGSYELIIHRSGLLANSYEYESESRKCRIEKDLLDILDDIRMRKYVWDDKFVKVLQSFSNMFSF
ncbi:uncharacterized protein LOC131686871 [Topomyia yanbarensis]|uniref:uncharacterized protein LOC131686871 n=1 Tax=Topomyia yanbarensis TaxID=2498891 RepID=UPI00273C98B0|nr:uncharacterized protein LOC131686871 [Topomyia yanbarensis]XP_058826866.1 uncharacterized protein LOC131686871 [Topomyia yanbarensis]